MRHPGEERGGLTQARLRDVLKYDKKTGLFRWLKGQCRGRRAGTLNTWGYRQIRVDGIKYMASRLAYLYVRGHWPPVEIDHRNLRYGDDRWRNLRLASHGQNCRNKRVRYDSRSRRKCVWRRESGNWQAYIFLNGRQIALGTHPTKAAAHRVVARANRKHFGRFARA